MYRGSSPCTVAEVADWLGLSTRRVKELRADGVLPGDSGEAYELRDCVRAYCAHIRPSSGRAAGGGADSAEKLDDVRIRLLSAQADAREMQNAQMRGHAVLASDMEAVVGVVLEEVRAKMLAVPTKAAPYLVGQDSLAAVRDKLTGLIHDACHAAADAAGVCDSITFRARQRAGRDQGGDAADEPDAPAAAADGEPVG